MKKALLVVALLLLFPFPKLAYPDWDVFLVDEMARPLSGAAVTMKYRNCLAERTMHEETKFTAADGHVRFNRRYHWTTALFYLINTPREVSSGFHFCAGRYAFVEPQMPNRSFGGETYMWLGSGTKVQTRYLLYETPRR